MSRQIHEPLVASLDGPYGGEQASSGLATSVRPSPDRRVWTVVLRPGVRFQDGAPFNASAVLDNARRWSSPRARGLLPQLFAVDAPRPNEVRFLFGRPVGGVGARLASPRLGIVSPRAFEVTSGSDAAFLDRVSGTGTGPFEAGPRSARTLQLTRYPGWWGTAAGLGPALDGITFLRTPLETERLVQLETEEAKVAEPFGVPALRSIAEQPLLRARAAGGTGIGFEASVRGLEPESGVPLLSRVWLTTIAG